MNDFVKSSSDVEAKVQEISTSRRTIKKLIKNKNLVLLSIYVISLFIILISITMMVFTGPVTPQNYISMNHILLYGEVFAVIGTSLVLYTNLRKDRRNTAIAFMVLGVFLFFAFCASANSLKIAQNFVVTEGRTSYTVLATGYGTPYYKDLVHIRNCTVFRMLGYLFATASIIAFGAINYLAKVNKKVQDESVLVQNSEKDI